MKTNKSNALRRGVLLLLTAFLGLAAYAQVTVTGVVKDQAGEPVIGASILEVGTTNGTITDFDGNFTLTVNPKDQLQVSYIGYVTQTLAIGSTHSFNITLKEDTKVLDDVVVVGYGVVKKNDATGSVTAIKPDDMNKGVTTNAQDMIQGKIAGVSVTSDGGTPGGGATIRIRGGSSLSASNNPLIVIDGLAMDNNGIQGVSNPLSMVNPADIETFTVLKDASATAIYGSRASNGVIIITTKKGSSGSKPKFSYEGNVSMSNLMNRMEALTGDDIRAYATALGHTSDKTHYLGTANTDWQDQIYRAAISTDHALSVTGGVKNKVVDMPYRASVGYTNESGIIKTSNMQRVTASFNLSPSFFEKHLSFNINGKGMYIHNFYNAGVVGAALSMDPTMPVKGGAMSVDGTELVSNDVINNYFGGYYQRTSAGNYNDPTWPYTYNNQSTANPLASLEQQSSKSNAGSFVGNIEADYKIHGFEDMHLHANFGADYSSGKQKYVNSDFGTANHYYGYKGFDEKSKYNLQFNAYAQYYKDFSETQHFDVMAGYEWQHFYNEYEGSGNGVYRMTNNDVNLRGTAYSPSYSTSKSESYLVSFFGRANWVAWNQLMVTATIRADGSSRFAKKDSHGDNARWGYFPSVALGWKIKESFFKDTWWLDELKLRLGYGITGQQDISQGDYPYMATYTQGQSYAYYPVGGDDNVAVDENGNTIYDADGNPVYYTYRPNAYNRDLKWEKTTTYNAGLDFAFLKNRIQGSFDWYYRQTDDLLNTVPVAVGTNFRNRVISNVGSLKNTGFEFALNGTLINKKNFKWDLGYNVTYNKNEIIKLNTGVDQTPIETGGISSGTGNTIQRHAVGQAANSFYVYESRKAYDEDGNPFYYVVDRNGDGEITADGDMYYDHSAAAPVTMGFQMKFQFYGFDLGMSFRSNIGNYVYNDVLASNLQWVEPDKVYQNQNGGYHGVLRSAFDTYWNEGMMSNHIYTSADKTGSFNEWYKLDYFVENASFLRCDNITLGYSFKAKQANKLSGRVYCTVSNPFVISKYSGLDPEIFGGIDNNIYPRSMTTMVGLSLQF